MPSARRNQPIETPQSEDQRQNETPVPMEPADGDTLAPVEATDSPTQAEQTAADTPPPVEATDSPIQASYQLALYVRIKPGDPAEDIVATADVDLGNICTIRNVKIKEDDYGLKVVMPRTKIPETGRLKDACYFHSVDARVQFDRAVLETYMQTQEQRQEAAQADPEYGGMSGMNM